MFFVSINIVKAHDSLYSGYNFSTTFYGGATVSTTKLSSNSSPYWIYQANRAISTISYNIIRANFTSNSSFVSSNNNYATGALIIGKDTTLNTNLTGISVNMADKPCEVNVFNSFTNGTMYVSYSCYSSTGWEINTSHNLTIFVGGWDWSGNERAWVAISDIEFVSYEDLSSKIDETNRILANIDNNISLTRNTINDNLNALISAINSNNQVQNEIKNNTKETNDLIKNDDVSGAESGTSDIVNNSDFQDNTGLSGIISMPLTFINNLGSTCSPISLTIPYIDYTFQLPCIQSIVNQYMPALVVVLKVVVNGLIIYWVMLDIFHIVKNAKNPDDDRIEVLDL